MKRHIRAGTDLVARYGGEEFIVVLTETGLKDALKVANRIRKDIENLKIAHPASEVSSYVTPSALGLHPSFLWTTLAGQPS
ncbi:MAG: diguanylate cyclase [Aquificota bacterium]|nr:diguanylate cyclase [Aquificota bacterium]